MRKWWPLPVVILIIIAMVLYTARYRSSPLGIPVEEATTYPDDPAVRSPAYGTYGNRQLDIIQRDPTHFDFIFTSPDPQVATITFSNIDLSLFIPALPSSVQGDPNLEKITLVEREWNRQQASFTPTSPHIQITGGDGFETNNTFSLELSRNCLNAGLWEVLLFENSNNQKQLYYQGWFTFPLGLYQQLFETVNGSSYWSHWYRLEHWKDPEGTPVDLDRLRTVSTEAILDHTSEIITVSGEQSRKQKTWTQNGDETIFATFAPPGRYDLSNPWPHRLHQITELQTITRREITTPAGQPLDEVELTFYDPEEDQTNRLLISGIDLSTLPITSDYTQGLSLPMGISVPPVYQTYDQLAANPPADSPYFSLLLNEEDQWINHHLTGVDGAILHRNPQNPSIIHLYLLSYERHTILGHYTIESRGRAY